MEAEIRSWFEEAAESYHATVRHWYDLACLYESGPEEVVL